MQSVRALSINVRAHWTWLVPVLVFLMGAALTGVGVHLSKSAIREVTQDRFDQKLERVEASIRAQFLPVNDGLQGLKGLYEASGKFQRDAFGKWVAAQDVAYQYPGVRGFGFIEKISRSRIDAFTAAERTDGAPTFRVRTSGNADTLFVVKFMEPAGADVVGLDVGTEAFSRKAVADAIDYGDAVLTRADLSKGGSAWGTDFLFLTPIYNAKRYPKNKDERQAALIGVLFAPLMLDTLLIEAMDGAEGLLDFEVFDRTNVTSQALVFSSQQSLSFAAGPLQPTAFESRLFYAERKLLINGQTLLLRAGGSPALESQLDRAMPKAIGLFGTVLSLLIALPIWLLLIGSARAKAMAQGMTKDLARLARVVKSTTHIVILGDANLRITWVNESLTQLTGLSEQAAIGTQLADLFQLEQSDLRSKALLQSALDNQEPLRLQIPWRRGSVEQRWFDLDLQIEHDDLGGFAGYIAIASDVTAQRLAGDQIAAALRDNQQLMDAIDRHSIVSITDHKGLITYANDMFVSISGYSRQELIGQTHRIVKSDRQPAIFWEAMWKTISAGTTWRATVCNRAKDGHLYWVDSVIAPFFDDSGNIDRYVSIRTDVSAARQAQTELASEREHLNAIIEGTDAGTWEWEVPTRRLVFNARWAEMVGYDKRELAADMSTMKRLVHPDDFNRSNEHLAEVLSGSVNGIDIEFRMRHRDDHWVWIQSKGKVSSRRENGRPQWISGIHLDVTAQKQMQASLREGNRVMQSILDNVPVALSVFDADLKLVAKNDKFASLLQFPESLLDGPGVTFEKIIRFNAARGEYDGENVEATIQTIIERARHTVPHQFERVRPNGIALEVRGAPMPGGGFVTTYSDISERKRAELEIASTSSMLQSVLDSASEVAVIAMALDGTISLFNKGAERMLGYGASEVLGQLTTALFFDPSDLQARSSGMSAQLNRSIDTLQALVDESVLGRRTEWTYVRKNGSRLAAALVVTAMVNAQGERAGYLGVSHDITQEKDNETWLRAAMEEAELAAQAKGQFLANMSHEIRTPMNAILGMLRLLQSTELNTRQLDYTRKTENAARSLLSLLNDILDFSKIDAGKMELDPQSFTLDGLMRNLSVILSANVGSKEVEVLFDIDSAVPLGLIGDAPRLQQVLINLGGNAIKFTQAGEVVVSVRLEQTDARSATLRFAIRDSGIGIAPENQAHIFSDFSQAEASTTRRFGGTGLGLSICRRLVELMGGELQLESALGHGSTFYFSVTMPIASPEDLLALSLPSGPAHSSHHGPLSALVVDDNGTARTVLAAMVASLGWTVDAVAGGAAALQLWKRRAAQGLPPYDVVFMDWRMPGMDGWDATGAIRALESGTRAPIVIMVTAQDRELLAQRSAEEQARLNGFLVKPVTAFMLLEAVLTAQDNLQNPSRVAPIAARKPRRLQGLRILLVEDNVINQQVASELLAAEGATIVIAGNGQLGVNAVAKAKPPFDAVLMDLQMPVMDGYTASVAIRNDLNQRDLPIIAMTANAMASDREACLAAGMNDHIGKPFELSQLVAMLQRYTGHATGPHSAPDEEAGLLDADSVAAPPPGATDIATAIDRLGGNVALYQQIVASFLHDLEPVPSQVRAFLESQQLEDAMRLLHTHKGLSATVGATHLAMVFRNTEQAVKAALAHGSIEPPTTVEVLCHAMADGIVSTRASLNAALSALQPKVVPGLVRAEPAAVATLALVQSLQALQGLLQSSDMGAVDMFRVFSEAHGDANSPMFQPLTAAMSAFDFAQGVVECESLIHYLSFQT